MSGGSATAGNDPQAAQAPSQQGEGHLLGGHAARMWDAGMGRRPKGKKGRKGDSNAVVPEAEFKSYYGRQILKTPVWEHHIAWYLFTGGLAAGSSLLAVVADLRGEQTARRNLRVTALGAVSASAFFLIDDLGRPERFHHMLRVAKITSPMSVGTWILTAYGPCAGAAGVAEFTAVLPQRGLWGLVRRIAGPGARVAGLGAAVFAPWLATYTAVLLADTAVPSWNAPYRELPFLFGGSALAASAGVALLTCPTAQTGPARKVAVGGAVAELIAGHRMEHGHGLVSEPFHEGRAGQLLRAARICTVAGAVGAVLGRRSRLVSALAGLSLAAGSALTRHGVFEAGVHSTQDPKYVVVPQRERMATSTP
ncbi:NrfD/PsrC family molybdoenzyme membrane anchor subunit [Kineococcus gynurae]|uniref:NrfD/PsrC family molybdoenzyme membrane anchor subunit n=1 Tax=Kineococcus gynurae TaxID=452979 RepID=A0ABV5LXH4_9ACTN